MSRSILLCALIVCGLASSTLGASLWRDRSAAIKVANGTHFLHDGKRLIYKEPNGHLEHVTLNPVSKEVKETRLPINGWYDALWTFGTYTTYQAFWEVPPAPTSNTGQILFFFNSFESSAYNDILQPVLQYNNGVAGWTLASWYGDPSGQYYESSPVAVNPGDWIIGIISVSGSTWSINGYVNGYLASTITVSTATVGATQGNAEWTLEVYNVQTCDGLPPTNGILASTIYLANGASEVYPSWSLDTYSTDCSPDGYGGWDSAVLLWFA